MANISPNHVIEQANQLIKAGQREKAYHLLRDFVFDFPDEPQVWWLIANLTQDLQEKRYALEQILKTHPNSKKVLAMLDSLPSANMPPAVVPQQMGYYPQFPTAPRKNSRGMMLWMILLIFIVGGISFFIGTQINNPDNSATNITTSDNDSQNNSSSLTNNATNITNNDSIFDNDSQNNSSSQTNNVTNNTASDTPTDNLNNVMNPIYSGLQGEWSRESRSSILVVDNSDESIIFFGDGTVLLNDIAGTYRFIDSSTVRIDFPPLSSTRVQQMSPVISVTITGEELQISHLNNNQTTRYLRPWAVPVVDDVYTIVPPGDGIFVTDDNIPVPMYVLSRVFNLNDIPNFPIINNNQPTIIATGTIYNLTSSLTALGQYPFGLGIQLELNGNINIVSRFNRDSTAREYGLQLYDGILSVDSIPTEGKTAEETANLIRGTYNDTVLLEVLRGNNRLLLAIPRHSRLDYVGIAYDPFVKPGGLLYITPREPLKRGHYCLEIRNLSNRVNYGCFTIP